MYRNTRNWQYIRASLSPFLSIVITYNMHVQKHSIQTIYSGLYLSRYDIQHACTETAGTDNIFGPLSRFDVQHACTDTLNTDNIFGPLALSLWRTTCMYRNTRYWQYIRVSFPLSRYDVKYACTGTLYTDNIFGTLSLSFFLSLWRTTCMYRNTQHWQYIRASLSLFLSRYDVQYACTETLDTDNIFAPLSLSLVMTYNMHVKKHSTLTIYSGLSLYLSLFRYDVQHAWTKTLDTDNIFGPLSLSLVMTYNMHIQKHSILTIYSGLSHSLVMTCNIYLQKHSILTIYSGLSLSLSLVMPYNMHVQKHSILTLYSGITLTLSLVITTTCMYRNTRYWKYIRASLTLSLWRTTCMYKNTLHRHYIRVYLSPSLVMMFNMHVQKHSILTIYSGLSLSLVMTYNMHVQKQSIHTI